MLKIQKIFEFYKIKAEKRFGIDLSNINIYEGKSHEFPKIRDFAYTTVEKIPKVVVSPKLKKMPLNTVKAIILHEIGHVIYILKKQPHTEKETDKLAGRIGNKHIFYDKNDVQTLSKTKKKIRPKYLKNPKLYETPYTDRELELIYKKFEELLIYGNTLDLSRLKALLSQGSRCTDCKKSYLICPCEKCPDCRLNRCMCDFSIKDKSSRNEVRTYTWNLIEELLSRSNFVKFRNYILEILKQAYNNYYIDDDGFTHVMTLILNSYKK